MMFSVSNPLDVQSICSTLIGTECQLYEVEPDFFLVKTKYGEIHAVKKKDVSTVAAKDLLNRKPEPEDGPTFVLATDDDFIGLSVKTLKQLYAQGHRFNIYSPSKILAAVPAYYYSDRDEAWQYNTGLTVEQRPVNGGTIGKSTLDGYPVMAINLEPMLVDQRDEAYIESLKRAGKVTVLDDFSQFLLDMEGIESEVLR